MKFDKKIIDQLTALGFEHKDIHATQSDFLNTEFNEGIEVTNTSISTFAFIKGVRDYEAALFDSTKKAVMILETDKNGEYDTQPDSLPDIISLDDFENHPGTVKALLSLQITPEKYINYADGRGKNKKGSVEAWYIEKCLNYAFLYKWSFDAVETRQDEVDGKIKLSVFVKIEATFDDGYVSTKGQWGYAALGSMTIGNALKSATSDGMKKAASLFGIARNVYGASHTGLIVR